MNKGPPPTGGDQNQAAKILTVTGILTSLSIVTVIVRFIARAKGSKHYGWDDWTMLAALVRFLFRHRIVRAAHSEIIQVSRGHKFGVDISVCKKLANCLALFFGKLQPRHPKMYIAKTLSF